MKIVFLSNYYTHHQQPLCEALDKLTDHQFTFVSTEPFSEERKQMGWNMQSGVCFVKDMDTFLCQTPNGIMDADVVLLGSAPLELVKERLKANKLVFLYAERVYKKGYQQMKWLPRLYRFWQRYGRHRAMYLLCASGYTAVDYGIHGAFLGKAFRWGYFPQQRTYELPELWEKKDPARILWCGRFMDWKHPEAALAVAKRLKDDGYAFQMDLVGTGPMEQKLRQQIRNENLEASVHLKGALPADQVRDVMESAGIYLFTSDFQEGWGAVVNEAMNSGCAVVASHAAGSVPFLLRQNENGLIYKSADVDALYAHVRSLLDQPQRQKKLGEQAYHTISELWNGNVAAQRLLQLVRDIENGRTQSRYPEGPCSKAPIIWNHWFRG